MTAAKSRPALFISWSIQHGRSRDLAAALGAEPVYVGIRRKRRRWLTPARYVLAALATARILLARRPRAIFVMQPPVPLAVLALVYGRVAGVPVALDAHTGAALAMRTGRPRRSLPLLSRFATVTIVTNSQLAEPLRATGKRVVTLHDAPIAALATHGHAGEFTVVAPLSWAADEPFEDIVAAARLCPDVAFVATGRAPAAVRERTDLPANLRLAGFLDAAAFDELMASAGVVLALTTRDATMQRAGYEAIALGRPVIASDTRVLREYFGDAALYAADGEQLAKAVAETRVRRVELAQAMQARRDEVRAEFARGIAQLTAAMGLDP